MDNETSGRAFVPFAYGFRPFFLLAGLHAAISIGSWVWLHRQGAAPFQSLPPQYWHGHEMTFGFTGAAIAGFLLTAVPSWTGKRGFSGAPVLVLTLLWMAGRFALFFLNTLPFAALAIAELLFLPALILMIAPILFRSANRNLPLLAILAMLWVADGWFLYGARIGDPSIGRDALLVALDLVLVLITIIGGRIVPAFTRNALRQASATVSLQPKPMIDRLVLVAMLAIVVGDIIAPGGKVAAGLAAIAAGLHAWRQSGWHGWRTFSQPIVWILHLAYLWLPLGFALKAATLGFGWTGFWQHALGAGATGTMIIAVMTRAALGHTGRPLRVRPSIVVAYLLLTLSVIVRVFGPVTLPLDYGTVILSSGILWIAAFIPFLFVYGPILIRPRVDGKPG
jgi:uncharacterized protein involved in response to NO